MTEHERAEFDRLISHVQFIDRVVITLLKDRLAMSTPNKDALVAAVSTLVEQFKADRATIASLTTENADLKTQVASLSAEDGELPAITQTITDVLSPGPAEPAAPEAPVTDPVAAETPAA